MDGWMDGWIVSGSAHTALLSNQFISKPAVAPQKHRKRPLVTSCCTCDVIRPQMWQPDRCGDSSSVSEHGAAYVNEGRKFNCYVIKVTLSLRLIRHHTMKTHAGLVAPCILILGSINAKRISLLRYSLHRRLGRPPI
jgi:hypothetical protein